MSNSSGSVRAFLFDCSKLLGKKSNLLKRKFSAVINCCKINSSFLFVRNLWTNSWEKVQKQWQRNGRGSTFQISKLKRCDLPSKFFNLHENNRFPTKTGFFFLVNIKIKTRSFWLTLKSKQEVFRLPKFKLLTNRTNKSMKHF